jgi:hypothetical protein
MPSCISMKPWIPARILAHLQIAAAAHLGGDLGRDAARLAFIGIETNDAERIGKMLVASEFSIGFIGSAEALTLVLPVEKYDQAF